MARSIFITGTDTGAGKTFVTAHAVRALLDMGVRARALKPVASGLDAHGSNADIEQLLAAQALTDADAINLYRFAMPASPHIAAEAERAQIDPARLVGWCRQRAENTDVCLIEGIGGLMVPLTDTFRVCDWISAMPEAEIWLVAASRLGAINHTLLTLEKLRAMGQMPERIILNDTDNQADAMQHLHRTISQLVSPGALSSIPFRKPEEIATMVRSIMSSEHRFGA